MSSRLVELGLGTLERKFVGFWIDTEEQFILRDRLMIPHGDLGNLAGNFGCDHHYVRFDISILGRNVPSTGQP